MILFYLMDQSLYYSSTISRYYDTIYYKLNKGNQTEAKPGPYSLLRKVTQAWDF